MLVRSLSAFLIVLLLSASLGAAFCGVCAADRCSMAEMGGMVGMAQSHQAANASPAMVEGQPMTEEHCQAADDAAGEPMPCSDLPSMLAADCCLVASAPEAGSTATVALFTSAEFALPITDSLDAPLPAPRHRETQPPTPRQLAPQPLYTLHSSLLI